MPIGLILSMVGTSLSKALSAAFTFLTTKPGLYVLIAALAAGAYWYSGHEGYKRAQTDDAAAAKIALAQATAKAADDARIAQMKLDKGLAAADQLAAFRKGKADAVTLKLSLGVQTYVTPEIDRAFPVACIEYRLLNAAGSGNPDPKTIGLPPGLFDGSACPITTSDVTNLGVAWAGLYHDAEAQIAGLQDLARTLKAAAEDTP